MVEIGQYKGGDRVLSWGLL